MKSNKIILLAVTLMAGLATASAQLNNAYFLRGATERYTLNPALSPNRGYFAIPALGLTTALESNFLSADNFLFPAADGNGLVTYMHSSVAADKFLGNLPDINRLDMNIRDRLISMGNYFRGGFWSVDVSLRSETNLTIPKHFFALTKTLATGSYDIAGLGIESNNFVEASLGYTFPVQDVFTIGFRAKALVGLAHLSARLDRADISIGTDQYTADLAGSISTHVAGYDFEGLTGEVTFDEFIGHATDFSNFSPNNISSIGFALDAGLEWTFHDEEIRISAAVTDLGFTAWGAQNAYCGEIQNVGFAFKGFDLATNEIVFSTPDKITMQTVVPEEGEGAQIKQHLHTNYVAGIEYNILNDAIGFGAVWYGKQYAEELVSEIVVAATLRPTPWLSATISEGYHPGSNIGVLGASLNLHTSWINLFVGVDHIGTKFGTAMGGKIPVPINQKSMNLTFGLSLPLGARMF